MPYEALSLAALPKREAPVRKFDEEAAKALLAIVTEPGSTATDGVAYKDTKQARLACNKAKRLLNRVAPEGKVAGTRIFGVEGDVLTSVKTATAFGWCVFLEDAPAEKVEKSKK